MNTIKQLIAWCLSRALLVVFVLVTGDAYAAAYMVSNNRSTPVVVYFQTQSADSPYPYNDAVSFTVPAYSTFGPVDHPSFWYGLQAISVTAPAADGAYPRTVSIGASYGVQPSGKFDGLLVATVWSDAYVSFSRQSLPAAAGSSSSSVLTSDEMETFKLGFWFVVGCGLFIVVLGVARMLTHQDHRP